MNMHPENQFGYLRLTYSQDDEVILVKANAIKTIDHRRSESITIIAFEEDHYITINQMPEQIIEQLENIHPTLR